MVGVTVCRRHVICGHHSFLHCSNIIGILANSHAIVVGELFNRLLCEPTFATQWFPFLGLAHIGAKASAILFFYVVYAVFFCDCYKPIWLLVSQRLQNVSIRDNCRVSQVVLGR